MATITSGNPVIISEEYPEWFIPAMSIRAKPDGEWSLTAVFNRARTMTESIMVNDEEGNPTPLLDRSGGEVKKVELLQQGPQSQQKIHVVQDIQKMAREADANGDSSLKDAMDAILTFLTIDAFTKGTID